MVRSPLWETGNPLALWERVRVRVFHMDLSPSLPLWGPEPSSPLWGPEPSSPLWGTGNPLALWERVRVRVAPELYQGFLEGEVTLQAARLTAKGAVPVNRPLLVVSLCRLAAAFVLYGTRTPTDDDHTQ